MFRDFRSYYIWIKLKKEKHDAQQERVCYVLEISSLVKFLHLEHDVHYFLKHCAYCFRDSLLSKCKQPD